jgi:hypothetical protein
MKFYTTIELRRRNYDKTKAFKYKANLHVIYDDNGIIHNRIMEFKECYIDLFTTKSWFEGENNNFNKRQTLFQMLGHEKFKQYPRPNNSSNLLKKLDESELIKLNDFFNRDYNSTIKNITAIIKGNNPGGEWKRPGSAEIVCFNEKSGDWDLSIVKLIDDLVIDGFMMYRKNMLSYETGESYSVSHFNITSHKVNVWKRLYSEQKFSDLVSKNEFIRQMIEVMQTPGTEKWVEFHDKPINKSEYEKILKDYRRDYSEIFENVNRAISRARSDYVSEIEKIYSKGQRKLPFNIDWKHLEESMVERCHIVNVSWVKSRLIKIMKELSLKDCKGASCDKLLYKVRDPDNFIPLSGDVHGAFDDNYFWYTDDGECHTREDLSTELKNRIAKYSPIDKDFLTDKRKEYIRERLKEFGISN